LFGTVLEQTMPLVALLSRKGESWLATASRARLRWTAACLAIIAFVLTQALHWLLYPLTNADLLLRRMGADALASVIIGLLAYRVFRNLVERRRALYERLQLIAELNHHIRNALQVIVYFAQNAKDRESAERLRDSIERIQWALREVLPRYSPVEEDEGLRQVN
jgi:signal transduction histidine kinase